LQHGKTGIYRMIIDPQEVIQTGIDHVVFLELLLRIVASHLSQQDGEDLQLLVYDLTQLKFLVLIGWGDQALAIMRVVGEFLGSNHNCNTAG
jgi:hypothetical protein